jgi:hypothetical protein
MRSYGNRINEEARTKHLRFSKPGNVFLLLLAFVNLTPSLEAVSRDVCATESRICFKRHPEQRNDISFVAWNVLMMHAACCCFSCRLTLKFLLKMQYTILNNIKLLILGSLINVFNLSRLDDM